MAKPAAVNRMIEVRFFSLEHSMPWVSGEPSVCKTVNAGSIPAGISLCPWCSDNIRSCQDRVSSLTLLGHSHAHVV